MATASIHRGDLSCLGRHFTLGNIVLSCNLGEGQDERTEKLETCFLFSLHQEKLALARAGGKREPNQSRSASPEAEGMRGVLGSGTSYFLQKLSLPRQVCEEASAKHSGVPHGL